MKTNVVLIVVALLAYWFGLCNASAFYDPGAQRWLNRDPITDEGATLIHHVKTIGMEADNGNPYLFVNNNTQFYVDDFGLLDITIQQYPPEIPPVTFPPGSCVPTQRQGKPDIFPCPPCPEGTKCKEDPNPGSLLCHSAPPPHLPCGGNGLMIRTHPGERVEITCPNGTKIRFGPNTMGDNCSCHGGGKGGEGRSPSSA